MPNYVENTYHWLKRKGYAPEFERAGIYQITIDGIVVYVGKSDNMLWRLAQHYVSLRSGDTAHKYQILREAKQRGHAVTFSVLYYAHSTQRTAMLEEIGAAEGEYIRKLHPPLNTQIPRSDNWRKYDYNPAANTVSLNEIIETAANKK